MVMYLLFSVKNGVMSMRLELTELKKQINQEEEAIKILKAEFSYLSSPLRLEKLNEQYLNLRQSVVAQLITDPLAVDKEKTNQILLAKQIKKPVKNWRYKKSKSRYLTLVANKK